MMPFTSNPYNKLENLTKGLIEKTSSLGDLPAMVNLYADKGEFSTEKFTDEIKKSMVNYLVDLGVNVQGLDIDKFNSGNYDEVFALAYQHAITAANAKNDPLDGARVKGGNQAGAWNFQVDTFDDFEEQGIIKDNILAAGAIDYVYELGEGLGIFRLSDSLVLNWSSGMIDVADGTAASKLYRYWKLRDERSTEEERAMLYKRVLNKGNAQLLDRMVANEQFPFLWRNLMEEVATYIDKVERLEDGIAESSSVSRSRIGQATKELQYNLTEYCTGMAHMQVREMYAQLQEGLSILRDPEIIAHFGGSRRKSLWTVIEQLSKSEYGSSLNIGAQRTLAIAGNKVFQWIANYDDATTTHEEFRNFLDAAESYILNQAVISESPTLKSNDDDFESDFDDDFESDFDDDF